MYKPAGTHYNYQRGQTEVTPYSLSSDARQALIMGVPEVSSKGESKHSWSCADVCGFLFGTGFLVSSIFLIGCAASGCFGSPDKNIEKWCADSCPTKLLISGEIISTIGFIVSCIFMCRSKE